MAHARLKKVRAWKEKLRVRHKTKTKSAIKKRIKLTATGKALISYTHVQKNKIRKSPNQKTKTRGNRLLHKAFTKSFKKSHLI